MAHKQLFTQVAKQIKRTDRTFREPQLMRAGREWGIGILIALILFGVSGVWGVSTYLAYRDASVEDAEATSEEGVVYRESLVEAALLEFEARQVLREELMKRVVTIEAQPELPEGAEEIVEVGSEEVVSSDTDLVATSTVTEVIQDEVMIAPPGVDEPTGE